MTIFQDRDTAKWMGNMPPAFNEWLEQEFNDGVRRLMNTSDPWMVGRLGGRLELLQTLRDLKTTVKEF